MNTILIGYDLNKKGQDYDDLIEKIKSLGAWWHYLDSTWIVKTSHSASSTRDVLGPLIDSNDELLVIKITGDSAAWKGFNERGSKWLKDNL
ncbi:hypothetical protein FHT40_002451 [Mycolicibacterium sp. BK556]|uniref:SinR family protein n=1 Tax=unclassified Mycolicibacterium TaxID=2636767 RepID=UPI001620F461|nr:MULTISPECIES: SinR family protein [unclassified Mycolicibacterium]MBB3602790.1 hypothetical protein [Mycolicibacterium sp. BK556]MBB3632985.1 hypothetical protein [Mycolicibacterium sp. BK607]